MTLAGARQNLAEVEFGLGRTARFVALLEKYPASSVQERGAGQRGSSTPTL